MCCGDSSALQKTFLLGSYQIFQTSTFFFLLCVRIAVKVRVECVPVIDFQILSVSFVDIKTFWERVLHVYDATSSPILRRSEGGGFGVLRL